MTLQFSLRRTLLALVGAVAMLMVLAGSALADPPPTHLHCLTTPNGDVHAIAGGVTRMANHATAFHNVHVRVHAGAFVGHPLGGLQGDTTAPYACPPSP